MPESKAPISSLAPPPTTSGGGPYIIAVILLVAAIGGLVFWKLKGSSAPLPVASVAPPSTVTAIMEPPPPPPPIEAVTMPDAGPTKGPSVAFNPCAGKCSGSASTALTSALQARAGAARPCYERALRVNSALQGRFVVELRIDSSGLVCSTSVGQDEIHSPEVSSCVQGMFRSARFPSPAGGCLDVKVPMSFVPREGK
jgi:hypothetical protein